MTRMPPHDAHQNQPGADPAPRTRSFEPVDAALVRSRIAAGSPVNPWDTGVRRAPVSRGRPMRIVAVLTFLVGVLILSAALLYGMFNNPGTPAGSPVAAAPTESTGVDPVPPPAPSPEPAGSVTSVPLSTPPSVSTTMPPPTREESVPASEPEMSTTVDPVRFRAPAAAEQCAANVTWRIYAGTAATSCPFAENVAVAMADHAGSEHSQSVTVASPVTGESYQMSCSAEGAGSFTCRGGSGAAVVLEHRDDI